MSASPLDTGHSRLGLANHTSPDSYRTFRKLSLGRVITISRSLWISTVHLEVRTGAFLEIFVSQGAGKLTWKLRHFPRFDNSGHRVSFPGWHSNSTNVQRKDNIIKRIAAMFATNTNVVSVIAPLNEYVICSFLARWLNLT